MPTITYCCVLVMVKKKGIGEEVGCACELLTSGLAGAVTFPSLLALTQTRIFKPLRISLGPGLSSSFLGLASVTFASFGASFAALKTIVIVDQYLSGSDARLTLNRRDLVLSTASGVVMFRALGGRFGAVLPSNLMRPGAFAAEWVPALRESEAATPKEREVIKTLGSRHGCHSCGEKRGVEFVADHQPPSKLIGNHRNGINNPPKPSPLLQRFYPQCVKCSRIQGGILGGGNSKFASHRQAVRTHVRSFRPYHMFLPLPLAIAYLNTTSKRTPCLTILTQAGNWGGDSAKTTAGGRTSAKTSAVRSEEASPAQASGNGAEKAGPRTAVGVKKDEPQKASEHSSAVEGVLSFPLLIAWCRMMRLLDSFNPMVSFHLTVWAFTIIAALGTA